MGCLKLTYSQQDTPLKVVYRKTEPQQKPVQRFISVDPMSDKNFGVSPYVYCNNNPIILVDPDGRDPILFGILQRTGEAKFGVSRLGESRTIGQFNVVPVYSADNKTLIAYNAGRYGADGEYRTEYQMEPGDLADFTKNISNYTAAAKLVYCNGEPDWNLILMTHYGMQGDYSKALHYLGQSWANAAKDPSFWANVAFSFGVSAIAYSSNNVNSIVANAEKGLFKAGDASLREAFVAGEKWVGPNYTIEKNGKLWVSADKTKGFKVPMYKVLQGKKQANLVSRKGKTGKFTTNSHIDIY